MDTTNYQQDDVAAYTTIGGEPFVTWPLPSPTSTLGINVRFYAADEGEENSARYRIDLGVETEKMLEQLYTDRQLGWKGIEPKQFEEAVRGVFHERLVFINAYGIATTLYVALTTDIKEMSRLHRRERHIMASQRRRLPYMTYPQYQTRPTTLRGRMSWFFGNLRARLFH